MADYRVYTKRNLTKRNIFGNLSITAWLIIVNVVFFIAVILLSAIIPNITDYVALKPDNILHGRYLWTLLTSMFMHGGLFHLFVNMFVLFSLGSLMERVIGRKRFFIFYLLAGIFAGLLFVVLAGLFGASELGARIVGEIDIPAVGASGAIFAIAGLFVILLPKIRFSIIFFPFFSLPGYIMIPAVLFLTWIVSVGTNLPVGNSAHFGGFIAGLIYGIYLRQKYPKKISALQKFFR